MPDKYRLVTRCDFDGLVCAVLLKEIDMIDDITFVHPKDMQDGKIHVTERDISTNLPYVEGVHLAFDHHASEKIRNKEISDNHIIEHNAPSAARVVYNYYGGEETFPNIYDEMMEAVDKSDTAQFDLDEVLNPKDWVLFNFIIDPRTGLGRFKKNIISNYQLMMELFDSCQKNNISEILDIPDVKERVDLYFEQEKQFKEQLKKCSEVYDKLVILDLRDEEIIYAGNRFMIYALYPECNISIHMMWGLRKQNTVFAVGKSIFNRSSNTNIGELMLQYGGGGHANAGTCQVDNDKAEAIKQELIEKIKAHG